MNVKQIGLLVTFAGVLTLNIFIVFQDGYIRFIEAVLMNNGTIAVFVDLSMALSLVLIWMWQDARRREATPLLHTILILFFGSIRPMLYLMQREGKEGDVTSHPAVRPASIF